jgi:hypothetical protein
MSETLRRPLMNFGSSRRAAPWAVVLLAAGAAGCMSCASEKPLPVSSHDEVVLLRSERQSDGHWKAIAVPNLRVVYGYSPDSLGPVVTWPYFHLSSHIKFEDPRIPEPTCTPGAHMCTLELPKGLTRKHQYKYTVTGKHDETNDLVPNDPWIEVDR